MKIENTTRRTNLMAEVYKKMASRAKREMPSRFVFSLSVLLSWWHASREKIRNQNWRQRERERESEIEKERAREGDREREGDRGEREERGGRERQGATEPHAGDTRRVGLWVVLFAAAPRSRLGAKRCCGT